MTEITSNYWQLSTAGPGEIVQGLDDIGQCISVLLATQKGSDPMRPTFGVDLLGYLDLPISEALPRLIQDIQSQVETWEPRAEIQSLTYAIEQAHVSITLTWTSALGTGVTVQNFNT